MATEIVAVRESAGQPVRPMEYQGARVEEHRKKGEYRHDNANTDQT
jgi:hypothetical protein